ncbi:MAG: cyclic nucleotide-binding domain-containing protein [Chloroflexota bacterium]
MELAQVLHGIDLFEGLDEDQLVEVAEICKVRLYSAGQVIAQEGSQGDEFYIITEGFVEVMIGERPNSGPRVVVSLGTGQIIGEMALLDQGPRSATVRATSQPTVLQVIHRDDFETLCRKDTRLGYTVMRNLAHDLSFKLRHRNLIER